MSSCDESNITKNYIVQSASDFDILSACTAFYTNNIYNCTGDTLTLHSSIVSANTINATTLSACTGIYTSNLYGCSPITVHDTMMFGDGKIIRSLNGGSQLDLRAGADNTIFLNNDSGAGSKAQLYFDDSISTVQWKNLGILIRKDGTLPSYSGVKGILIAENTNNEARSSAGVYEAMILNSSGSIVNSGVTNSIVLGGGTITATTDNTVYVPNLNIGTTPLDNSLTQILSRDSSDGTIKYRDVASIISAVTSADTYVTGFTYDDSNNLTITRNDGTGFTTTINQVSGLTVNGTLSATTLDGGTILSGGTNLLTIIDDRDTFVTGTTFTSNQSILTRNDNVDVLKISGGTNVTITSGGTNLSVIDVTIPPGDNTFITAFTYDDINAFTITDNLGTAFTASINVLSATTISATTFYGDGSNLTGIPHTTDTFESQEMMVLGLLQIYQNFQQLQLQG